MAPVRHVHVLERGHVVTLCCTNSRAFFVLYVRLFYFINRSVLFSAIKMHVRQMISSQAMNAAEYCALVKNTASWLVQPFAGAADSKWGVSHQSSYMGWTFNDGTRSSGRALVLKKGVLFTNKSGTTWVVQQQCHPHSDWWEEACDQKKARSLEDARALGTVPVGKNNARAASWGRKPIRAGLSSWVQHFYGL